MAETKKTSAKSAKAEPIADVAEPGKSKPAGTSKPVIITNRPILKDPMVLEEGLADSPPSESEGEKITVKTKSTIKPLSAPAVKVDEVKSGQDDKPAEPSEDKGKSIAELAKDEVAKPVPEAKPQVPPAAKPSEPRVKPPEPKATPEPAPEPKPADAATDTGPAEPEIGEEEEQAKPGDKQPADPDKEAEAKAAEQAKHDAAIDTLVESKKYYLPINAVERRRSKKIMILGALLCVLLALAWVDVALDAGLIQVNGIKPVTHFFSN